MSREAQARFCERVWGKFLRSTRPINSTDPDGSEKFGIGIESPKANSIINGELNLAVDTGHAIAYVKNNSNQITSVLSFGPADQINAGNVKQFQNGSLPGTGSWPLGTTVNTWEWEINSAQYATAKSNIESTIAHPGNYSPTNQCASCAIDVGAKIGLEIPNGISGVTYQTGGYKLTSQKAVNPYGLETQLIGKFGAGKPVSPQNFPIQTPNPSKNSKFK